METDASEPARGLMDLMQIPPNIRTDQMFGFAMLLCRALQGIVGFTKSDRRFKIDVSGGDARFI